ncbi:hypothetical protein [Streptomyces sp. NPDC088725]|uniref:hypothetical protein n=1 Tax=Streptomyces sp. NPDC088725 TaxID=3365873 RepID=UPI0038100920
MTQQDIFGADAEWLPELRQLLQAYRSVPVPADECFVDSEDAPSRGMRSYLRVAVYYPARPFRATREIAEIIHLGINHWDVRACLATMPPIIPPRGKVRIDCLLGMIPYLAAFENEGYREVPIPPDSSWEWRERFPNLSQLVSRATWRSPAPSEAVVLDRLEEMSDHRIAAARRELDELRGIMPETSDWAEAIEGLGAVTPIPGDLAPSHWLARLDDWAEGYLKANGYRPSNMLNAAYPAHDLRALL